MEGDHTCRGGGDIAERGGQPPCPASDSAILCQITDASAHGVGDTDGQRDTKDYQRESRQSDENVNERSPRRGG